MTVEVGEERRRIVAVTRGFVEKLALFDRVTAQNAALGRRGEVEREWRNVSICGRNIDQLA